MDATIIKRQIATDTPLKIGCPEDFARVRSAFLQPGFEECVAHHALLGAGFALDDFLLPSRPRESEPTEFGPLIALFVEQKEVPREQLEHLLDRQTLTAFQNLDLIRVSESDSSTYYSPVVLYPIDDFLITSDYYKPRVEGWAPPADSVYAALHSIPRLHLTPVP